MYYCLNPTVGAAHAFTSAVGEVQDVCISVLAFKGVASFETGTAVNGTTDGATTVQTLSVTPVKVGDLLVTGLLSTGNLTAPVTIDSGFTIADMLGNAPYSVGVCALAYLISPDGASVAPTWTQAAGDGEINTSVAAWAKA
jgi:hypothetical protein